MPKIKYEEWRPQGKSADLLRDCVSIAERYARQGYDLTVRQLYYQLVAADRVSNTMKSYRAVSWLLDRARMNGSMDWNYIIDRTRSVYSNGHWTDPDDVITSSADAWAIDLWSDQPRRVEVWVEKQALEGVIGREARNLDVSYFACRGYSSTSAMWQAAQRFLRHFRAGQSVTILHFGDHDPSGIDMTRDIEDRLRAFLTVDWARLNPSRFEKEALYVSPAEVFAELRDYLEGDGEALEIRRVALNMDQIQQYQPPPNPAKITDSRFATYQAAHGDDSWELDALDPTILGRIVRQHVDGIRDDDLFEERVAHQEREREVLTAVATRWSEVKDFLGFGDGS